MSPARPVTVSLVMLLAFLPACGGTVGPGVEGYFATLPPGTPLPSGADCATRVRRSSWEPRPGNATANQTRGQPGVRLDGASDEFNAQYAGRIDGDFTGTTDEIIQWGACKWGLDEDIVRAVAVVESGWRQDELGEDWSTFGIMQVRSSVHAGTYPSTKDSTAYGIDYALAWRRACYEGDFTWMNSLYKQGGYDKGDEWGCVGAWFSGDWYDGDENVPYSGAKPYIKLVKQRLAERTWTRSDFKD